MEMCKIILVVAWCMSLFVTFALAASGQSSVEGVAVDPTSSTSESHPLQSPSFRRVARALAGYGNREDNRRRPAMTCDKYPRVCRADGSPGPDCCGKKCINTMTDNLNCGWCGMRCWYGSVCCGGRCVGIMYDRENCGGCGKRCKKGSYCRYGMCSYGY